MFLKDFLFPKFCLGCGFLGSYICLDCQKKLNYIKQDFCLYCYKKSYLGLTHLGCQRKFGLDGFLAIFYYNNLIKRIIKNIKYQLATEVLNEFFNLIDSKIFIKLDFYKNIKPKLYLQSIPLHPQREKERGFNQSRLMAEFLSNKLFLPMTYSLERFKNTPLQAQLAGKKDRYFNMRGAFKIINNYKTKEKSIVLIDDVVTTGATIKEAAAVLKRNKVEKVFAFSLAKG